MAENNKKEWTFMIYMAGDNNLSVDMAYALQQIKDVVKDNNKNFNLFVYYDGYSPAIPTFYCDFSDSKNQSKYYRSQIVPDKLYYEVRDEFDENSAAARSVINFVDWCVNKVEYQKDGETFRGRKADRYALIFSGHTLGFHSVGLLKDEKANHYMTLKKIKWLLERITKSKEELERDVSGKKLEKGEFKKRTTEVLGKKLDILGFDSCVMSMLEVGYQFNRVAETLVASEGSIPNAGWTYAQIFGELANNSIGTPVNQIAREFVESFILRQDKYTLGGVSVDMAAWDLSVLHEIEAPFERLVSSLLKCFDKKDSIIYKQMNRILLQVHWKCQSYMMEQSVDLSDFCELLKEETDSLKKELAKELADDKSFELLDKVSRSCAKVTKKIKKCIILSGFSGGKYQYSNGISLFFPWSLNSYKVSRGNYKSLVFICQTKAGKKWNKFLSRYLSDITFRRAKPFTNEATGNDALDSEKSKVYPSFTYAALSPSVADPSKLSLAYSSEIIRTNEVKIPENGTNKIPENGTNKIPENGTNKIPENGENRIPENGTNRIPENGANRMFGVLGLILDEFMDYKNTETPWYLSGFTKTDTNLDRRIERNRQDTIVYVSPDGS